MTFEATLTKLMTIHTSNFSTDPLVDVNSKFRELCKEHWFDESTLFPAWFDQLLDAVLCWNEEKIYFDDLDTRTWNVINDLHELMNWSIQDFGEAIEITFPNFHSITLISTEGRDQQGRSSCFFKLTDLRQKTV